MDRTSDGTLGRGIALPVAMTGTFLVAPEIVVSDLVRGSDLQVIPGLRTASGMQYRAYAVGRSDNSEISRAFCRWLFRLCKKAALLEAA